MTMWDSKLGSCANLPYKGGSLFRIILDFDFFQLSSRSTDSGALFIAFDFYATILYPINHVNDSIAESGEEK